MQHNEFNVINVGLIKLSIAIAAGRNHVIFLRLNMNLSTPDIRKGADARTLSAEVLMDRGNIRHDSVDFIFI